LTSFLAKALAGKVAYRLAAIFRWPSDVDSIPNSKDKPDAYPGEWLHPTVMPQ
jgi:hypothetical protein